MPSKLDITLSDLDWTTFKGIVDARRMDIQYVDVYDTYYMKSFDGFFQIGCAIPKDGSADQTEFETNYKNKSNRDASVRAWSNKLRYRDMNVTNGGIARNTEITTTWTDAFSRSGTGLLVGFLITLEDLERDPDNWCIRLLIDGEEIFASTDGSTNGICVEDLSKQALYGIDGASGNKTDEMYVMGFELINDSIRWHVPCDSPMEYKESVVLKIKTMSHNDKFKAGLITLSEE